MITVNATLVVQMLQFIILVFILNRLMLRPLLTIMNERMEYTENTKIQTRDIELKINELKEQFISREREARREAAKKKTDIVNAGMARAEDVLQTTREEISSIRVASMQKIEQEMKKARPLVKEQAESLIEIIMEKTIGRRAGS
ncbi:MAG: hypothetical protein DRH37_00865 [Deltaproteobacteria bacterium]|nr:MAG: hypothetical protein DRH37_00865 [Deltaproteobacteria bacterium]